MDGLYVYREVAVQPVAMAEEFTSADRMITLFAWSSAAGKLGPRQEVLIRRDCLTGQFKDLVCKLFPSIARSNLGVIKGSINPELDTPTKIAGMKFLQ